MPGKTVSDKMLYLRDNKDWLRKLLMYEPRGNEVMSGAILTEPCDEMADIGVIFIEVGGYLPMCGHDTIGVSTMLIETGIIEPVEPYTVINLDTPAGLVKVKVRVEDDKAREVSFTNVPSFVFAGGAKVEVPAWGEVEVDIAYGGNFFAIVSSDRFGFNLKPEESRKIIETANTIKSAVNEQIKVYHPEKPFINEVTHVEFSGKAGANYSYKNAVVIPPGSIDRSPCGTGTAAKAASLFKNGLCAVNEAFFHESIIGTFFKCSILEETKVGDFPAVITEVTGSAYITGFNTLLLDPDDPLQEGFWMG